MSICFQLVLLKKGAAHGEFLFVLKKKKLYIGSSLKEVVGHKIQLRDPRDGIASQHVEIFKQGSKVMISNLTNDPSSVFVNEDKVGPEGQELKHSDMIKIGDKVTFRYEYQYTTPHKHGKPPTLAPLDKEQPQTLPQPSQGTQASPSKPKTQPVKNTREPIVKLHSFGNNPKRERTKETLREISVLRGKLENTLTQENLFPPPPPKNKSAINLTANKNRTNQKPEPPKAFEITVEPDLHIEEQKSDTSQTVVSMRAADTKNERKPKKLHNNWQQEKNAEEEIDTDIITPPPPLLVEEPTPTATIEPNAGPKRAQSFNVIKKKAMDEESESSSTEEANSVARLYSILSRMILKGKAVEKTFSVKDY